MDVRAAMTARPVTVTPGQSLEEAAALMRRGRFRHLPVTQDGALVGIITERDLHGGESTGADGEARRRPVRTVMAVNVVTIGPDDPVEEAARLMLENKVGCLPVLDGAGVAGIITESDIFRAFVRILGVLEPGTRIQIRTRDLAGALEGVGGVARARGIRVAAVASEVSVASTEATLVVRFATPMIAQLTTALRASGLDVVEPDPGATG